MTGNMPIILALPQDLEIKESVRSPSVRKPTRGNDRAPPDFVSLPLVFIVFLLMASGHIRRATTGVEETEAYPSQRLYALPPSRTLTLKLEVW
ncbi:hypothetical protein NLI96_g1182 [Meripilus lineatus]|uniref:Uncharacterized protein n=1 Tax=Meripilus lineatus TaxID=2056292 RepID=A0AAD5VAT1_9APHY|nr:hypothetical protein NLI96_g1182 [Physisporinus lineatus]